MKMKDWKFFGEGQKLTASDKIRRIALLKDEIREWEDMITTSQDDDPEAVDAELIEENRATLDRLRRDLSVLEESEVAIEEEPEEESALDSQQFELSLDNPNYDLNKFSPNELRAEITRLQARFIIVKNSDPDETRFLTERIEAARSLLGK